MNSEEEQAQYKRFSQAYGRFHMDRYWASKPSKKRKLEAEIDVDTRLIWDLGKDDVVTSV